VDKHDNLYPRHHLHPDTLWDRFLAHVEAAGAEHFTPHDLRRTFAGDMLEAGHDLVKVQRAMGHTYPSQTDGMTVGAWTRAATWPPASPRLVGGSPEHEEAPAELAGASRCPGWATPCPALLA
jgi:hypothetical protein